MSYLKRVVSVVVAFCSLSLIFCLAVAADKPTPPKQRETYVDKGSYVYAGYLLCKWDREMVRTSLERKSGFDIYRFTVSDHYKETIIGTGVVVFEMTSQSKMRSVYNYMTNEFKSYRLDYRSQTLVGYGDESYRYVCDGMERVNGYWWPTIKAIWRNGHKVDL